MSQFEKLNIGAVGLVQETKDGRIRQIGLTEEQSKILQLLVASISKGSPLVQMSEEYDLVLKSELNTGSISKRFTEKQMNDAYDKGYIDGLNTDNTPM